LIAVVVLIYRQVDRQLTEGKERIEAEVMASYEVVQRASEKGDIELMTGFLSGRDESWAAAQKELVGHGGLMARPTLGTLVAESTEVINPTLMINSNLQSAEIATPVEYILEDSNGLTETITLLQVSVFRPGPDRWLLSPPDEDFWGSTETVDSRYLNVSYPSRDAELAARLAADLDALLAEWCAALADECPKLDITLSTNPASLPDFADAVKHLSGGDPVALPAPSLFGEPLDEAGYFAVYRAYATRVVNAANAHYAGWTCCDHALFYTELQEAQLHELGLRSWPELPESFERLIDDPELAAGIWQSRTVAPRHSAAWPIHALVEFLVRSESRTPIPKMQRSLLSDPGLTYRDWLSLATDGRYATYSELERDFMSYAAERRMAANPPTDLPQQNLQLVCRTGASARPALFRYDLSEEDLVLVREFASTRAPAIVSLPSRDGVAVAGLNVDDQTLLPALILRGETEQPIEINTVEVADFVPLPPQAGQQSLIFYQDTLSRTHLYSIVPLANCSGLETCSSRVLLGQPEFSPDNQRSIVTIGGPVVFPSVQFQPVLYLGDGHGRILKLIGPGSSPFWLDEETFGYVVAQEDRSGQGVAVHDILAGNEAFQDDEILIVAQNVVTGGTRGVAANQTQTDLAISEPEVLFTTADLDAIPFLDPDTGMTIDRVLPSPNKAELYFFTSQPRLMGGTKLLAVYDLDEDRVRPRFYFGPESPEHRRVHDISPAGNWLLLGTRLPTGSEEPGETWLFYLHNIDEPALGLTLYYPVTTDSEWPEQQLFDWSADGRWLAVVTHGYIRLIAPDAEYNLPLAFEDLACSAAVWINED
jgi:hypothetical protein